MRQVNVNDNQADSPVTGSTLAGQIIRATTALSDHIALYRQNKGDRIYDYNSIFLCWLFTTVFGTFAAIVSQNVALSVIGLILSVLSYAIIAAYNHDGGIFHAKITRASNDIDDLMNTRLEARHLELNMSHNRFNSSRERILCQNKLLIRYRMILISVLNNRSEYKITNDVISMCDL